jgi:hypothetical protein
MNEHDVERVLERYRPVGPPERLRARILTPDSSARVWPWAAVAAALLALVVGLNADRDRLIGSVDAPVEPDARTREIQAVAEMIGVSDARTRAEAFVLMREQLLGEQRTGSGGGQ